MNTKYKLSIYNNEFIINNQHVIYNSYTGSVLKLNEEYYQYYLNYDSIENRNILEQFVSQGLLVKSDIDEYQSMNTFKRDESILNLTITPTISCNFCCSYCFEKHKTLSSMSTFVADQIPLFLKNNFPECDKIFITWFGGEPTLAINIIKYISDLIIEQVHPSIFLQSIVTNGYLLNKNNVDRLKNIGINDLQITLDGAREFHDEKRYLPNHKPTYNTILKNLEYVCDKFNTIIRVNVDKNNLHSTNCLLDDINKLQLKQKPTIYLALIRYDNKHDINCNSLFDSDCHDEFLQFYNKAIDMGFNINILPHAKQFRCEAVSDNGYVITPSGNLCCCWEEVDKFDSMPNELNIFNFKRDNSIKSKWQNLVTDPKECQNCSIYPICRGGCPKLQHKTSLPNCDPLKYHLKDYVELFLKTQN